MAANQRHVAAAVMLVICLPIIGFGVGTGSVRDQLLQKPASGLTSTAHKKHRPRPAPVGYKPGTEACLHVDGPELNFSYLIEATYDTYARNHPPSLIRFVRETPEESRVVLTYPGDGHVLNMISREDGSVVVIVFELGSGMEVKAFRLENSKALLVFDRGAETQPEFPWGTILLNVGKVLQANDSYYPKETEIWTWTGQTYKLAATVPFKQRYDALQKLPPSAWK